MRSKFGDKIRLQHILDAIIEIESYIGESEFADFMNNSMLRFACIKQIEIIGEASNYITKETKNNFSEIEWGQIVGMRNVLVHEYFGIDATLIWQVIKNNLPALETKITEMLKQIQ